MSKRKYLDVIVIKERGCILHADPYTSKPKGEPWQWLQAFAIALRGHHH